jgi:hypothetical protein
MRLCCDLFLVRDEFGQNRHHMPDIRCGCDLSPLLSPENQPAFSPSRESDSDHSFEAHTLEFRVHILRISLRFDVE